MKAVGAKHFDELKENAIRHGETKALESIAITDAVSTKGSSSFCRLFRATLSCRCEIIGALSWNWVSVVNKSTTPWFLESMMTE